GQQRRADEQRPKIPRMHTHTEAERPSGCSFEFWRVDGPHSSVLLWARARSKFTQWRARKLVVDADRFLPETEDPVNATVSHTRAERVWASLSASPLGALLLLLAAACDRAPAHVDRPPTSPIATPRDSASAEAVASAAPSAAPAPHGQGDAKIPFDFPQVATTAPVGGYVLAPPRSWIDAALEKGADKQAFIYYGGWMRAPGPAASQIETLTQQSSVIPNALIVAIPKGKKAEPGQLVLTSWASGTGMQRAIVVPGGSPDSPKVRYLDMSLEHPTGWGERDDRLPRDAIMPLEQAGGIGATAACREGDYRMRYIITARSGDRLLGYGFAGKIA